MQFFVACTVVCGRLRHCAVSCGGFATVPLFMLVKRVGNANDASQPFHTNASISACSVTCVEHPTRTMCGLRCPHHARRTVLAPAPADFGGRALTSPTQLPGSRPGRFRIRSTSRCTSGTSSGARSPARSSRRNCTASASGGSSCCSASPYERRSSRPPAPPSPLPPRTGRGSLCSRRRCRYTGIPWRAPGRAQNRDETEWVAASERIRDASNVAPDLITRFP